MEYFNARKCCFRRSVSHPYVGDSLSLSAAKPKNEKQEQLSLDKGSRSKKIPRFKPLCSSQPHFPPDGQGAEKGARPVRRVLRNEVERERPQCDCLRADAIGVVR